MNNFQQTARVGLFFLLGLALTWVTFETLRGGKIFKDQGYNIIAGFETLKELKDGDEVRMAGVKIGEVEKTRLAGRRAEAVLRINPDVKIKSDATATIIMAGPDRHQLHRHRPRHGCRARAARRRRNQNEIHRGFEFRHVPDR